tara:strand:- start:2346 stop:2639 length:294 start_codon:yes stop_codon:yes gene_type:complete
MSRQYNVKTSDSLSILLTYISLIGIWFAIPSVTLLINKDSRWPWAVGILGGIILLLIIAYIFQWRFLFPISSSELVYERNMEYNFIKKKEKEEKNIK